MADPFADLSSPLSSPSSPCPSPSSSPHDCGLSEIPLFETVIAACESCRGPQRRNFSLLVRRVKAFSFLLDEVRESEGVILPPSALHCFGDLRSVLERISDLLRSCRSGSRVVSAVSASGSGAVAEQFQRINRDIAGALNSLSLRLLDVPEELKEQIELLHRQCSKADLCMDARDGDLRCRFLSALDEFKNEGVPDLAKLREIFYDLELHDGRSFQKELQLLEEKLDNLSSISLIRDDVESSLSKEVPIMELISFVRYCCFVLHGVAPIDQELPRNLLANLESDASTTQICSSNNTEEQVNCSHANSVPEDYVCPISLELMRDPVTVATGQTYDRGSISRWIKEGHLTCPISGLKLENMNLIPNYALRSLIYKWCEEQGVPYEALSKGSDGGGGGGWGDFCSSFITTETVKTTVSFLLSKLSSGDSELRRQVAYEFRLLAKCGTDNRRCIGEMDVIPRLVSLLSTTEDPKTQENAVTALLNLSIYDRNKELIVEAGALDPIIGVVASGGNAEARENAAATLFSLSIREEYKALIGNQPGAITCLLELLRDGSPQGRKDAVTALFNIAVHQANKPKLVEAGAVSALVELLVSGGGSVTDDALAVMALIAGSTEGIEAISNSGAVPIVISLLRASGTPRGQENALAVLLPLCKYGGETITKTIMNSPSIHSFLFKIRCTGTPRAKRKATSLLKMFQKQVDNHMDTLVARLQQPLALHS